MTKPGDSGLLNILLSPGCHGDFHDVILWWCYSVIIFHCKDNISDDGIIKKKKTFSKLKQIVVEFIVSKPASMAEFITAVRQIWI